MHGGASHTCTRCTVGPRASGSGAHETHSHTRILITASAAAAAGEGRIAEDGTVCADWEACPRSDERQVVREWIVLPQR